MPNEFADMLRNGYQLHEFRYYIIPIWDDHSEKLKVFIYSKVNGADYCHDILHDVFLKITEKEERIKWVEQPASYVIKMAQNTVIDYYRSQKKISGQLQEDYTNTETIPEMVAAIYPFFQHDKLPDFGKENLRFL